MSPGGLSHPRRRRRRRRTATAACSALLALALAGPAASAQAKVIWVVKGGGFGHGVGLSQYGAYGFAKHKKNWRQIVSHYYLNTTIGPIGSKTVRVLLRPYLSSVRFTSASSACGASLSEGKTYSAARSGNSVLLRSPKGSTIKNCGGLLSATGGKSVSMLGKGSYRGALQVRPSSVPGRVNAINALAVDQYVQGVVALESPASWPMNALRAQAVVARSYGLASSVGGKGFDLYDTTSSQVYGGIGAETARTNQAVADTRLQVVKYKGQIAQTFFFSTSGGYTENNENVFGRQADRISARRPRPLRRRLSPAPLEEEVLVRRPLRGPRAARYGASSARSSSSSAGSPRGSCRRSWSARAGPPRSAARS